jgi:uncharacterized membrane protein YhhN
MGNSMKKIWLLFFVLISVTELVSVTFDFSLLHSISKPLILPMLMGYFLASASTRNFYFLSALIFCWAGDVLLMFQGAELFFIFGLVAFLIGHLFYMISYRKMRSSQSTKGLLNTQKMRYAFPIVLAGTGLVTILFPYLGALKIPVMIYALVLTLMVLQALFRYGFTSGMSFLLIFIGAISFMLSDSILAINKFMQPLPMASLAIMSTYIVAQYLIVEGAVQHHLNEKSQL